MWLSIQDEMLIDRYLSDPHKFACLVKHCRGLAQRACKPNLADDAIDLLESLFRLGQNVREELASH